MHASPTSILAATAALSLAIATLAGCAATGSAADVVTPDIVAVNPELATLPDIEVIEDVTYAGTPEQPLLLDACLPNRQDASARAAIVVVHGGSWTRGDKADIAWRAVCQWLASSGYVTFSINYRLAPQHVFPAAIDDVRSAVAWLRTDEQVSRFKIDPDRIGAFGGSAGGNLVALLGTLGTGDLTTGTRVAAVAELSGPTDLTGFAVTNDFVPVQLSYLGCQSELDCAAAVAASPIFAIDASDPPFFVAHSTVEMIPFSQAETFVAALRAAEVPTEFVGVEGTLHSVAMLDADLKTRIVDFFNGTIGTPAGPLVQADDGAG